MRQATRKLIVDGKPLTERMEEYGSEDRIDRDELCPLIVHSQPNAANFPFRTTPNKRASRAWPLHPTEGRPLLKDYEPVHSGVDA